MSKHTPGPWFCGTFREAGADPRFNGVDIGADNGVNVGIAFYQRDDITPYECKANARLIAASPDLLSALKSIADPTTRFDTLFFAQTAIERFQAIARAAIAKAEERV
jgi:hypothetical protein